MSAPQMLREGLVAAALAFAIVASTRPLIGVIATIALTIAIGIRLFTASPPPSQ